MRFDVKFYLVHLLAVIVFLLQPTRMLAVDSSLRNNHHTVGTTSPIPKRPRLTFADQKNLHAPLPLPTNQAFKKPIMVVIDPGHGGKDSGAKGPRNTLEKDIVLSIAQRLQQTIKQQPGFDAKLTRYHDVFIPLRQRLEIAKHAKADIFVAIHADAAYNAQSAAGVSVFALSERGATSENAKWLAQKENESEILNGVVVNNKDKMLRSVLMDLSATHTISVSLAMGKSILNSLSGTTKLHHQGVEQAAFVVLKSPDIPSLLIETGYLSNPAQEQKLNDPVYQQQLASAIAGGITNYFAYSTPQRTLAVTDIPITPEDARFKPK